MDQRERYRTTPPPKTLDDMPLAAYGGTGMEEDAGAEAEPATEAEVVAAVTGPSAALAASHATAAPAPTPTRATAAHEPVAPEPAPAAAAAVGSPAELPVPEDEPSHGPSPLARIATLLSRMVHLFRTSRVAAGAGFAVVIVVGLVLLSSGNGGPAATAATPTKGPTPAPTVAPPSGDASLVVSGAATGTFPMTGATAGQQVSATTVALAWSDGLQNTLTITGPLDRGTRSTDEGLVLTVGVTVAGQPVTFTSMKGECTVGMAQVGTKVQGSFTCHRLRSADGKLTIEASGNYRT